MLNALRAVGEDRRANVSPEESTLAFSHKEDATDLDSLQAKLRLSKYGARMWISFLVPDYRFDPGDERPVTLRVDCLNFVDRRIALRIRLFLSREDFESDTFVARFRRNYALSLGDGEIEEFLKKELNQLSTEKWFNTSVF